MIRDPDLKLAFVHVPRTGGTSIRAALRKEWPSIVGAGSHSFTLLHQTAGVAQEQTHDWGQYFSFAVVRNPWDRMISMWSAATDGEMPLGEFLRFLRRPGPAHQFMQPQTVFVLGD